MKVSFCGFIFHLKKFAIFKIISADSSLSDSETRLASKRAYLLLRYESSMAATSITAIGKLGISISYFVDGAPVLSAVSVFSTRFSALSSMGENVVSASSVILRSRVFMYSAASGRNGYLASMLFVRTWFPLRLWAGLFYFYSWCEVEC